ncbi:hypothetical protein ABAC460_02135 [Asticcacaulis sp. AC460]|uniref:hypothetical protein n=1 Tax=Asticcacaulis sp. AC460 TaxID=1282360 RepID=UPI0003C3CD1F|nr:hypothetical protein [Asticcacaulis sp. AC460]ESQ93077.1 hypothetical protein ABAC460_02135 [Asticcacaulis sp. AC460]
MRLNPKFLKSIVFIGHGEGEAFQPCGTGFIFGYCEGAYLVTADHIAHELGSDPFFIRINRIKGGSDTIHVDPEGWGVTWFVHPIEQADVAVLPFHYRLDDHVFSLAQLNTGLIVTDDVISTWAISAGEMCQVAGLFRLVPGSSANTVVIHSGNIAAMPAPERIPFKNWRTHQREEIFLDAYLVEISNLRGLSGAPVFVRPSVRLGGHEANGGELFAYSSNVFFFGVWSASWEKLDVADKAFQNGLARLPVGMGIVTPAAKVLEILESPPVIQERTKALSEVDEILKICANRENFFQSRV